MTSCLFVKAPRQVVAVADGRLSVSDVERSFEDMEKIVRFTPRYRIPKVSVSRFSHYSNFTGEDCLVCYAGSYAVVLEVLNLFRKRISERLILVWRNGKPTFSERFDETAVFFDDYEFRSSDLLEFTPDVVVAEFRAAAQERIDSFCNTRRKRADCEFILFGKCPQRGYYAFKITVDPAWSPGQSVRLNVEPINDGMLTAIGSAEVSGAAFSDEALRKGLEGWQRDQEAVAIHKMLADPQWEAEFGIKKQANSPAPACSPELNWSQKAVTDRLGAHILASDDPSVGGDLTIAQGGWYGEISVRTRR